MSNATDLLRRALDYIDQYDFQGLEVYEEIETYLAAEPEAEPVAQVSMTNSSKAYVTAPNIPPGTLLYRHPPKPAEPEAEPVAWMFQHEDTGLIDFVDTQQVEWGFEKNNPRWQKFGPVFLHPPKPAESEAETIETLKAENFALASGQCTEGGPWGDEGGTPYCKYAARKPMTNEEIIQGVTVDTSDDFHAGYWAGIRFAEKHHGIGGGE